MLGNSTLHIDSIDRAGFTSFHLAAYLNRVDMAKLLIEGGADINGKTEKEGLTALHMACAFGYVNIISLIVTDGYSTTCFEPAQCVFRGRGAT